MNTAKEMSSKCKAKKQIPHCARNDKPRRLFILESIIVLLLACVVFAGKARAGETEDNVCPRPAPASLVQQPPELRSKNGRLELTLRFNISEDGHGLTRFCYFSDSGLQSPTLRVKPGDELVIHFRNELRGSTAPPQHAQPRRALGTPVADQPAHGMEHHCADAPPSLAATNLHFHGLNVPARCHQDDVMQTLIGPATNFDYRLEIPANAAPGLYWYHPHPHAFGETQVQGGASGALIVEGIAAVHPEIRGLPERVLVLRDQKLPLGARRSPGQPMPGWDVSLNHVPVLYPDYAPAVLETAPDQEEFWRVLNAAADTILDLQVIVNDAPRPLRVVAIDGVPLKSTLDQTDVLLPPGSRVEFVVNTPAAGDRAQLLTKAWDTGPDGENDPRRPLATIVSTSRPGMVRGSSRNVALSSSRTRRSTWRKTAAPVGERKLYFSEIRDDPNFGATSFYLTVEGQVPARFKMDAPPNIVVRDGTTEDWTIENRSREEHVFHIHQIHFQVLEKDGKPVRDPAWRDTIDVPYWKGEGPYPSVKVRMDFRDANTVGTLMYHCHILQHSANGMMGSVQVVP